MTIKTDSIETNLNRLTNQIWKLLPMRENNEDWQKQVEMVVVELSGLGDFIPEQATLLQLLCRLKGLLKEETSFEFYRKTVFDGISLIQEIKDKLTYE